MDSLEEMREQAKQYSFAAKQAYINALEFEIARLQARVKELELETDYMESLTRAKIEAETKWAKSMNRVKELEEGIEKHRLETYKYQRGGFIERGDARLYTLISKKET
jgi:hypothetical protein